MPGLARWGWGKGTSLRLTSQSDDRLFHQDPAQEKIPGLLTDSGKSLLQSLTLSTCQTGKFSIFIDPPFPLRLKKSWYVLFLLGEILPSKYSAFIIDTYENNRSSNSWLNDNSWEETKSGRLQRVGAGLDVSHRPKHFLSPGKLRPSLPPHLSESGNTKKNPKRTSLPHRDYSQLGKISGGSAHMGGGSSSS